MRVFRFSDKEAHQNLLDSVMCINTSTPGCIPSDILSWVSIKPPAPQFLYSDLSNEIGFRWMLDTEERLKKQDILLDSAKRQRLSYSAVQLYEKKLIPTNDCKNDSEDQESPMFISPSMTESVVALPGFSAAEVRVTKFPNFKPNNGIIYHPRLFKLVICDEYPSYSYGGLY